MHLWPTASVGITRNCLFVRVPWCRCSPLTVGRTVMLQQCSDVSKRLLVISARVFPGDGLVQWLVNGTRISFVDLSPCGLRLRNDLYCVEWGVKLYSLTRLPGVILSSSAADGIWTSILRFGEACLPKHSRCVERRVGDKALDFSLRTHVFRLMSLPVNVRLFDCCRRVTIGDTDTYGFFCVVLVTVGSSASRRS